MTNKLRNRKAVSALVATVLLILITVIAIAILWTIVPRIKQTLQLKDACLNARLMIDTEMGYTCYDDPNKRANLMVTRGAEDFELSGMQLGITQEGMKKSYIIKEDPSITLSLGLEEGEGVVTSDASGKKNNGRISGAAWTQGKFGSALDFDANDDFVSINASKSLDLSEGVTIEFWVKINGVENFSLANFIVTRD